MEKEMWKYALNEKEWKNITKIMDSFTFWLKRSVALKQILGMKVESKKDI